MIYPAIYRVRRYSYVFLCAPTYDIISLIYIYNISLSMCNECRCLTASIGAPRKTSLHALRDICIVNCGRMMRHQCQARLHDIETVGQVGRVGLTKCVDRDRLKGS